VEKSQHVTGNGANAVAEPVATMVAPSRPSRKSAVKPISNGPAQSKPSKLSDEDLLNITMNGLVQLQERFGTFSFVPATVPDEPALLVLSLKLNTCPNCGKIVKRSDIVHCNGAEKNE